MKSVRLKELPSTVVDEFVNMQLKNSYRSSLNDSSLNAGNPDTPTSPYRVEYRLVKKKKGNKPGGQTSGGDSPSSLRYMSPIPGHMRQTPTTPPVLKPINEQVLSNRSEPRPPVPDRKVVKTPELIKLSVQRLGSFESVMFPVGRSVDNETPKQLPVMKTRAEHIQQLLPAFTHKFVCPECKSVCQKELVITVSEEARDSLKTGQQNSADRPASSSGSTTMGTQTDAGEERKSITEINKGVDTACANTEHNNNPSISVVVDVVEDDKAKEEGSNENPDNEPVEKIELSEEDWEVVRQCRSIAKETKDSIDDIKLAVRKLALIAQDQVPTAKGFAARKGRLVCQHIGDALSEEGFDSKFCQFLESLTIESDTFNQEENYHSTCNLYTCLTSFTVSGQALPQNFVERTKVLPHLVSILGHKKNITQLTQKKMWRFFDAIITKICHLSRISSSKQELRTAGVVGISKKFMSSGEMGYVGLWLPSTVAMSRIADDEEMAAAVKGKVTDFVPPVTAFITSYFTSENATSGNDSDSRVGVSASNDEGDETQREPTDARSPMPNGASVQLVEISSAFVQFLSLILIRNKTLEKDFQVSQSELDELVKCSVFLMKLKRPVYRALVEDNEISLNEWRVLVNAGIEMAGICYQLAAVLQLSLADGGVDPKGAVVSSLSELTKIEKNEHDVKATAQKVLDQILRPRIPTPALRSVTETIQHGQQPEAPPTPIDSTRDNGNAKINSDSASVAGYSTAESLWNSSLVSWNNSQVRSWVRSIGLGKYEAEFEDYDGSMLLALYDVRRESPQYFQKEMAAKLGCDFNNLVRFTAELTKLVAANNLNPTPTQASGIDRQSVAPSAI